jgi:hypothetical protein
LFLPQERVVFIKPAGAIHENDKKNVLHHGFCFGMCKERDLISLEAAANTKQLPFLHKAFNFLNTELTCCQVAMMEALPPGLSVLGRTTATASLGNQPGVTMC